MDDFQKNQIANPGNGRRTYLVAYSQADLKKFPTRESFGAMLEAKFNAGPGKASRVIGPAASKNIKRAAFIIMFL